MKLITNKGVPVISLVKIGAQDFTRKPGAWAGLPKASTDWDSPKTNAAIAEELTGDGLKIVTRRK